MHWRVSIPLYIKKSKLLLKVSVGGKEKAKMIKKSTLSRGVTMKRNIGIVIILMLGLLLISCAAQTPIPENARIVELNVPTCA